MKIGYLMQAGVPDVRRGPLTGPAIHVKNVCRELHKLGHRVCLLAVLDGQIWTSADCEHFEQVRVQVVDQGLFRLLERIIRRFQYELKLPYAALFESIHFALACRQELAGYDLFYERKGWVGYGGALAANWMGIPLVFEVNGDDLTEMDLTGVAPRGAQLWLSTRLMKMAVRMASHHVATGEGWRRRYIDRWGTDPGKVSVVNNGTELVNLLRRDQLHSFSQSANHSLVTTIAYSGGFDPWQGVTILIRAVSRVIAKGVQVRLLLIGSGSGMKMAEQLVRELQLSQHVTFTGQLTSDHYSDCLAGADIGVAPYCGWAEYAGLKLLDYKAAGLAIIASGENGQPAIIDHGRTGWIVPPCDENCLYEAIVRLSTDSEYAKRIGREARVEAERCHSWMNTANQLNNLFIQVARDNHDDRNRN